jgi:hypothetical protein
MREVVVLRFCDGDHIEQVSATVEEVEGFGGEPMLLDLCNPCFEVYRKDVATVQEWLRRGVPAAKAVTGPAPVRRPRARPTGRKRKEDLTTTCNQCGYTCPTRTALGQHTKQKHDMTLTEAGL